MKDTKVRDRSGDKKYFTITPRIVWALSRSPYDFMLWNVIKDIAGDSGECILGTEDLAALAMMSAGKVADCRQYLISVKLLEGTLEKDPEYHWPIWHLTIPDLWELNVSLSKSIPTLKKRVEFKIKQKHKAVKCDSPGEWCTDSPGEKTHSPGEKTHSPGEKTHSPGVDKEDPCIKNHIEEPGEEGEAHPPAVEIQNSNGASNGKAGEINLALLANPENYPEPQIEHEAAKLAEKFVWEVFSPAWQKKMGQPYVPEYGGKGEIALLHLYKICIKSKTPALVRFRAENFFASNKAYFFDRSYSLQFFCSVFNELDKPKFDRPKQNAPHANDPRYMRS